jgi:TP901-1 family phage major tail protein
MPTTGIVDGTIIRLELATEKIVHATSSNLDMSLELTELSSKDTGGGDYTEQTAGKKSWSASCEGLYSYDDTISSDPRADVEALFDAWEAGTAVAVKWTTGVTGDVEFSGNAFVSNVSFTAPNADSATYSFQLTGTGAISKATIS